MTEPLSSTAAIGYGALAVAAAAGLVASDAPEKFLRGARDAGRDFARGLEALYFPTAHEVYDIAARNAALDRYVAGLNVANALHRSAERLGGDVRPPIHPIENGSQSVGPPPPDGPAPWFSTVAATLAGGLTLWSLWDRPAASPVNMGDPEDTGDRDTSGINLEEVHVYRLREIYRQSQALCDGKLAELAVEAAREMNQLNVATLNLFYYRARTAFKNAMAFFLVGSRELSQCTLKDPLTQESCLGVMTIGNLLTMLTTAAERKMHPGRLEDFSDLQGQLVQLIGGSFGDFELLMRRPAGSPRFFEDAHNCLFDHLQKLLCQSG